MTGMKTILLEGVLFAVALSFALVVSQWFQAWVLRRKLKRLKAHFARLQRAVSEVEQMKSIVTHWHAKNVVAGTPHQTENNVR